MKSLKFILATIVLSVSTLANAGFTLTLENHLAENTLIAPNSWFSSEPIVISDTGEQFFLPGSSNDITSLFDGTTVPVLEYRQRRVLARNINANSLTININHYQNYCADVGFFYDLSSTTCNSSLISKYNWLNGFSCIMGDKTIATQDQAIGIFSGTGPIVITNIDGYKTKRVRLIIRPDFVLTSTVIRRNSAGHIIHETYNHSLLSDSSGTTAVEQCILPS